MAVEGFGAAVAFPKDADGDTTPNAVGFAAPNGAGWVLPVLLVLAVVLPNLKGSDVADVLLGPNEKLFCGTPGCTVADPEN